MISIVQDILLAIALLVEYCHEKFMELCMWIFAPDK